MTSHIRIKSSDIKPGDIIKFEYGTYDNWVTVRIDEVHLNLNLNLKKDSATYYPLKLIWHYLSDEPKESRPEIEIEIETSKDCRAEKLGNNPAPYRQFTCYSNLNDLVEKLN